MPEREECALGYVFRDKSLLRKCFTHASLTGEENNERLEFLGDAVLELYVTDLLFRTADAREGELTERRQQYVSREALSAAERRLGLLAFLRYRGGEDVLRGKTSSNLYEAAVGAIYLDGGYRAAEEFLARTLAAAEEVNYKSLLQEHVQRFGRALPVYETAEEGGGFRCTVTARGRRAEGEGTTKKAAEQAAAKSLYGILIKA